MKNIYLFSHYSLSYMAPWEASHTSNSILILFDVLCYISLLSLAVMHYSLCSVQALLTVSLQLNRRTMWCLSPLRQRSVYHLVINIVNDTTLHNCNFCNGRTYLCHKLFKIPKVILLSCTTLPFFSRKQLSGPLIKSSHRSDFLLKIYLCYKSSGSIP